MICNFCWSFDEKWWRVRNFWMIWNFISRKNNEKKQGFPFERTWNSVKTKRKNKKSQLKNNLNNCRIKIKWKEIIVAMKGECRGKYKVCFLFFFLFIIWEFCSESLEILLVSVEQLSQLFLSLSRNDWCDATFCDKWISWEFCCWNCCRTIQRKKSKTLTKSFHF